MKCKTMNSRFVAGTLLFWAIAQSALAVSFTGSLPTDPSNPRFAFGGYFDIGLGTVLFDASDIDDDEYEVVRGETTFKWTLRNASGTLVAEANEASAHITSSLPGGTGIITAPGEYTITFEESAKYNLVNGNETRGPFTAALTPGNGGRLSMPFWLIAVDHIEISGNGASGTVSDGAANLLRGTKYTFTACRAPANSPGWPAGWPSWSSSGIGLVALGDEAVCTFNSAGDGKTLTVSCGVVSKTATFNSVMPQIQRVEFQWDTEGIDIYDKDDKWQAAIGGLTAVNDPACYVQGQKGKARLKFYAARNLTYPVTVSVRGDVHWFDEYITGEDYGRDSMVFGTDWSNTGVVESEANAEAKVKDDYDVDISWRYKVRAPNGSDEWIDTGDTDNLRYYLVWAKPTCNITILTDTTIAQSCEYAEGKNSIAQINQAIMDGIENDYVWNGNCHFLSSNFVRMVLAQGIEAILHKWATNAELIYYDGNYIASPNVANSMIAQHTIPIRPIGNYSSSVHTWGFHQWAESNGKQYDPSTNYLFEGTWGGYEDYLFSEYLRYYGPNTVFWEDNQIGQSEGCEANGIHTVGTDNNWNGILQNWLSR